MTGFFGFAWATMQFIFSPILGAWSDRYGRRPIILISCAGLGFDYILMALAPTLSLAVRGRLISGITTSNISTAFAYVTDVTPPERRAKQFGLISAAFGLGFIIGPAVGGLLGNVHLRLPFWVAAGLSLTNAIYGYFILPESLPPERRVESAWHMANPLGFAESFTVPPRVGRPGYRHHHLLPGAPGAADRFRAVRRLPLRLERTHHRFVSRSRGCKHQFGLGLSGWPFVKRFGERHSLLSGLLFGCLAFLALRWLLADG